MTNNRKLILSTVIGIAVLSAALAFHRFTHPPPTELLRSISPDGKVRLVIYDVYPTGLLAQSPYLNHMRLYNCATNAPLPGNYGVQNNDGCTYPASSYTVAWTATDVTVEAHGNTLHSSYSAGSQHW